ncbi:MAG: hypothetical protein DI565_19525 [Ancylobacter novellus]|uniref:Polysaccharide pyruvyl transferase domain-containing protein n=1 Tax=Ancylobacter novellus TaxID=921 RepID=A0A2W5K1Z0_ANCNO|nr:MAG: hypothetical protein DI565_19525 [Ancylobacter novellus]
MTCARTAAIFGTFDVSNYGDLLFPIVAADRLSDFGFETLPVSPTDGSTVFADALPATAYSDLLQDDRRLDGVLIGGGEIVHVWRGDFLEEYRAGSLPETAYPSLWFGAGVVAALADAPIAWNAPGAPTPLERNLRRFALEPLVAASDYVSARDKTSAIFIGRGTEVAVSPDTVAGIARVWPKSSLERECAAFRERAGLSYDARLIALHTRPGRIPDEDLGRIGAQISALATAHGLTPVLVGIGPSLDDGRALAALDRAITVPTVMLDRPRSLVELASVIAGAALYLGTSMHGYVTAAAYDSPGVIVARPGFRKYAGFAEHIGRREDIVRSWDDGLERADALLRAPRGSLIPDSVHAALDAHWERVARAFDAPRAKAAERAAFLRSVVAHSVRDLGLLSLAGAPLGGRPSEAEPLAELNALRISQ